jgi:hypothetical protein
VKEARKAGGVFVLFVVGRKAEKVMCFDAK